MAPQVLRHQGVNYWDFSTSLKLGDNFPFITSSTVNDNVSDNNNYSNKNITVLEVATVHHKKTRNGVKC